VPQKIDIGFGVEIKKNGCPQSNNDLDRGSGDCLCFYDASKVG
jgi:hypothetical protein